MAIPLSLQAKLREMMVKQAERQAIEEKKAATKVAPKLPSKPVVKPTWTEAKAPVTAESQSRDLALAQRVVSTTPGAFGYGVARGVSMPVTSTAKLLGYQESPEEAAVRTLAESKRLTAQMDASKGMGAPNIIQGRSVSPEMVGRVVGSVLPFSAAESAVGRVLPSIAGQGIKQTALRGAVAGGALQGLEEAGQGKRGMELAGSVALGTALGAGADIGLGYLAKAIRGIRAGQKAADVVADIAQNAPQTKVTIEQELGLPEGSSWLDIQRKMEEEEAVEALYQKYETMKAPEAPEVKSVAYGDVLDANGKQYKVIDSDADNYITVSVETGKQQVIPKAASAEFKVKKPTAETIPLAQRDNINVGDKKVKAYQHENPEYKPYFQEMARNTLNDIKDSLKGQKMFIGEVGEVADSVTGVTRQTSSTIASILDTAKTKSGKGLTYAEIQQGLENIIKDKGSENTAAAKRIELYLDDALTNGYKTVDGVDVPPNAEYIAFKQMNEATKAKGLATQQQGPDIERELFPSTMRKPSPGPVLPEPAVITAQRRAQETLRPMAPEPQVITPQVKPKPSAAIPERMAVDGEIGVAPKPVHERMAQEAPEIGVGTLDVKAGIQPGQKQSKLYTNTIPNSEMFTPQELENLQIEFEGGYTPKANAETLANAKTRIAQNGADAELETLKQKDTFNSDDFVTSMEILKDKVLREARETGDYSKVTEMLELIRKSGSTEAGRVVQAHQIYSRTPEGMLALAKKVVDNVNAKGGKATLTPDDIRNIDDSMRKFQDLPPGRDKDAELSKVKQIIADKVPSTFIEKYRSLQRILWLLNPKTLITRNPLGNLILQGAEGIKNIPATGLDYLVSLKTGKRTTAMAGGYIEGAKKGLKEQILDIKQGVDTAPTGGQAEIPRGKVWDSAELEGVNKKIVDTLDALDTKVGQLLKLGDRPFYEGAYNSRINQLKKLNKTEEVTEAMAEDARLYALERTLQKDSELAKTFQRIKAASDNPAWQVFANTLLPFTKTPANILDKMFEYSPGGFVKAATQIGKKGDAFDQKYFVDNVSRALTGTGLIALGYIGAKNGFITGKPDKDKEVAAVERLIGRLPYAFVTDGGSYTFDWAQPVSALLAIGADAYYGGKDKETFTEQLSGSAEAAGNTFFNLGMLQGFTRAFGGYSPTVGLIKSTTEGVSGLSTPAITSQTAKTIDPYVRETDKQLSKKILAKTPGASFLLEPKLDLYGRPIKQSEGRGVAARALENFLSPGFYATGAQSTPGLKEAYRVYKATGEKDIFPRLAPETITVKGDVKKLTPELKVEFQKDMGSANLKSIETLIKSSAYKSATDEDRAKMLNDLIKDNREATKKRLMPKIEKLP